MINASFRNRRETGVLDIVLECNLKEAQGILWRMYVVSLQYES